MNRILEFLQSAIPQSAECLLGSPIFFLLALGIFHFAGWLRDACSWKVGYTRKVVHVQICLTAFVVQTWLGFPLLCLFGGWVSVVLGIAVWRGANSRMFRAVARESDHPHERYYIVVPYIATLLGGGLSNLLFPGAAVVGYLVTGMGDAVGEPVGTRWGRHRYPVPTLTGIKATRSLEGSAAVLLVSVLAAGIAFWSLGAFAVLPVLLIGIGACLIEAISPHGWDNATLQLVPAAVAAWFLG